MDLLSHSFSQQLVHEGPAMWHAYFSVTQGSGPDSIAGWTWKFTEELESR